MVDFDISLSSIKYFTRAPLLQSPRREPHAKAGMQPSAPSRPWPASCRLRSQTQLITIPFLKALMRWCLQSPACACQQRWEPHGWPCRAASSGQKAFIQARQLMVPCILPQLPIRQPGYFVAWSLMTSFHVTPYSLQTWLVFSPPWFFQIAGFAKKTARGCKQVLLPAQQQSVEVTLSLQADLSAWPVSLFHFCVRK